MSFMEIKQVDDVSFPINGAFTKTSYGDAVFPARAFKVKEL